MPVSCKSVVLLIILLFPAAATAEGIVIAAVGDIMLAGSGRKTFVRNSYDYPFAATTAVLKNSDLAIGNLEAPITTGGVEYRGKRFRFRTAPAAASAIKRAGFTFLSLANNHILDFGVEGLRDTMSRLETAGILHAGAGTELQSARREALATAKGKTVAFLAYSLTQPVEFFATPGRAGTAPGYSAYFTEDIARAKHHADYVIVSFHWGAELATFPKPYQITAAHRAIDAGADVVIGHHPHVLQGAERYGKGVILYSLGNFTFGSMGTGPRHGVIARIKLDAGVEEVELVPINVDNRKVRFQPRPASAVEGRATADHFTRISGDWGTVVTAKGGRFILDFADGINSAN
jgi:poly-gamma-glutamate capsule biosynthesis protein CapA/YwtB (metallophosphatase superfamily)